MIATCRTLLVVLVMLIVGFARAAAQELNWHDATSLQIEGMGWSKTAGPFDRLPDSAEAKVNKTAWKQSKESAGIAVRFVTDAQAISVRWSLTSAALAMPHMPATGCSGVDLYARSDSGVWRFIANGRPGKQDGNVAKLEFADGPKPKRECLLYLPLYNGTKSLEIGVPNDAHLESAPPRPEAHRTPIVIYGTSITQGGCALRPGLAWPSILGRLLDRPVINLGFSASGDMAPPVGETLAELDPAAYIIDCTWNLGAAQDVYTDRITQLVQTLRKSHPQTPILFMGQSHFRPEAHPTDLTRRQQTAVEALQKQGVEGLTLIPSKDFIGDDGEGTVDGVHLNDLGMDRQARSVLAVVGKVLGGQK